MAEVQVWSTNLAPEIEKRRTCRKDQLHHDHGRHGLRKKDFLKPVLQSQCNSAFTSHIRRCNAINLHLKSCQVLAKAQVNLLQDLLGPPAHQSQHGQCWRLRLLRLLRRFDHRRCRGLDRHRRRRRRRRCWRHRRRRRLFVVVVVVVQEAQQVTGGVQQPRLAEGGDLG